LILTLIDALSLAAIAGTEDSDDAGPIGETDGQDAIADASETAVPQFLAAVGCVFSDDALRISECVLGQSEGHTMLGAVVGILVRIPLEARLRNGRIVLDVWLSRHIPVWPAVRR
jgi:hypothetical protein